MHVTKLDIDLHDAFIRMLDDYKAHNDKKGESYEAGRADFAAYIRSLDEEEQGVNVPDDYAPCSHRWLIDDGEIVGIVRTRHHLNSPFLMAIGHIGYDVPPTFRGRGYGTAALRAGLDVARSLGITKVRMCCGASNPASWKTIERCGGVLEEKQYIEKWDAYVHRYWITIAE